MYFIMKYVATLNGKRYEIEIERVEEYKPLDRGVTVNAPAPILAKAAAPAPAAAGGQSVDAPMPGKILDIKVKAGDAVSFGQCVVVMEAMKMETEIVAPAAGTVASVNVSVGDAVDTGAVLVTLN